MKAATVPREVAAGEIASIPGIVLPCAVLSDGRRVLSTRGITLAFDYKKTGAADREGNAPELPAFMASNALKPFISDDLVMRLKSPIRYLTKKNRPALGYECTVFPAICKAAADKAGRLGVRRAALGGAAAIILDALVGVGMIALVDSATGYEKIRPPHELERQLGQLIMDQVASWERTFTETFYRELFRLRGVPYHPTRRPRYFGALTNDLVYERIAPGMLAKLREKNPADENGQRDAKYHQWLTRDLGYPALREHLALVVGFMKLSSSWESLIERLDHVAPRQRTNLYLLPFDQMQPPAPSNDEKPTRKTKKKAG